MSADDQVSKITASGLIEVSTSKMLDFLLWTFLLCSWFGRKCILCQKDCLWSLLLTLPGLTLPIVTSLSYVKPQLWRSRESLKSQHSWSPSRCQPENDSSRSWIKCPQLPMAGVHRCWRVPTGSAATTIFIYVSVYLEAIKKKAIYTEFRLAVDKWGRITQSMQKGIGGQPTTNTLCFSLVENIRRMQWRPDDCRAGVVSQEFQHAFRNVKQLFVILAWAGSYWVASLISLALHLPVLC